MEQENAKTFLNFGPYLILLFYLFLKSIYPFIYLFIFNDNSFPFVKPNTSTTTKTIFLYFLFI